MISIDSGSLVLLDPATAAERSLPCCCPGGGAEGGGTASKDDKGVESGDT